MANQHRISDTPRGLGKYFLQKKYGSKFKTILNYLGVYQMVEHLTNLSNIKVRSSVTGSPVRFKGHHLRGNMHIVANTLLLYFV
jgi:hypothetical protein